MKMETIPIVPCEHSLVSVCVYMYALFKKLGSSYNNLLESYLFLLISSQEEFSCHYKYYNNLSMLYSVAM